jgi:hypothetical protein
MAWAMVSDSRDDGLFGLISHATNEWLLLELQLPLDRPILHTSYVEINKLLKVYLDGEKR